MGAVSRIMGAVSRIMGAGSRTMGDVSRIMGAVSRIMGAVSRSVGSGSHSMGGQGKCVFSLSFVPAAHFQNLLVPVAHQHCRVAALQVREFPDKGLFDQGG